MNWQKFCFVAIIPLTRGERELIATYVSSENDCFFCQNAHGGLAQHYLQCDMAYIDQVKTDFESTDLAPKVKALLAIAGAFKKEGSTSHPNRLKRPALLEQLILKYMIQC